LLRAFSSQVNGLSVTHSLSTQAKLGQASESRGLPQLRLFSSTSSTPVGDNFAIEGKWALATGNVKVTDYQASQPFEYSCGPNGPSGTAIASDSLQRPLPSDGNVSLKFILGGLPASPPVSATCKIDGEITLRLADGSLRSRAIAPLQFEIKAPAPAPVTPPDNS
jgi:hypothetical protein